MTQKLLLAMAISLCLMGSAQSNMLVDTGQPSSTGGGQAFAYPQTLLAQFILNQAATINAITGWINAESTGMIQVQIYQDSGDTPGTMVYSQIVQVASTGAAWIGASTLNWSLRAGKYWVGFFDTMNTIQGSMPTPAPTPLAKEGYIAGPETPFVRKDDMDIGVRISGSLNSPGLPASFILLEN
jgi:hypothetical protein